MARRKDCCWVFFVFCSKLIFPGCAQRGGLRGRGLHSAGCAARRRRSRAGRHPPHSRAQRCPGGDATGVPVLFSVSQDMRESHTAGLELVTVPARPEPPAPTQGPHKYLHPISLKNASKLIIFLIIILFISLYYFILLTPFPHLSSRLAPRQGGGCAVLAVKDTTPYPQGTQSPPNPFFPDCCLFRYFHTHTPPPAPGSVPSADNGALIGSWQRPPGFRGLGGWAVASLLSIPASGALTTCESSCK